MVLITPPPGLALEMNLFFNLDHFAPGDGRSFTRNNDAFVFVEGGVRYEFTGSALAYNERGDPIAGTFTDFRYLLSDIVRFEAHGISVSAAAFYQAAIDRQDPFALMFAGNDEFRGSALRDVIFDRGGHNIIMGGDGGDALDGGPGNDHIYGGSPNGGPDGDDIIHGGGGSDYLQGNAGNDQIAGDDGSDRINGGADNDGLFGGNGNDTINGNRGDDYVTGDYGNDLLRGGQGNDYVRGGPGDDIVMGDLGADHLSGEDGADIFVFGPGTSAIGPTLDTIDRIDDFLSEQGDRISLGYMPQAILSGQISPNDPATIAAAETLARTLFRQHSGDHEVAIIGIGSGEALMFWGANGGTIDSVVRLQTINGLPPDSFDLQQTDFI